MSELVVVRHAQASLFSDNYDQLSELGRRQSAMLGEYLLDRARAHGESFDHVFTGPAVRHRDTHALAAEVLAAGGHP